MSGSLKVLNTTRGPITFFVNNRKNLDNLYKVSKYHRRRMIREDKQQITLPPKMIVDLVLQTGLTPKQLKDDAEFKKILKNGTGKMYVVFDSDIMTPPKGFQPVTF